MIQSWYKHTFTKSTRAVDYITWFRSMAGLHQRGHKLIIDLVLNHSADENP
jgi:pullulanase/glycogen debranching enzyme